MPAQVPFPLGPALETACFGGIFAPGADSAAGSGSAWQPDWPADIPPDAFSVKGEAALIRLSGTSARLNGQGPEAASPGPFEYRLSRDSRGRLVEFPLSLGGDLFQIRADYAPSGGLAGLVFGGTGEGEGGVEQTPWIAEFPLPYSPFESPAPQFPGEAVRVSRGEAVYFVLFEEGGKYLSESWYDGEGNLAGYFVSLFEEREGRRRILSVLNSDNAKRYYFDNQGHVSAIRGPWGNFSAVYGARGQVLEWEFAPAGPDAEPAPPGRFALQWDERFLLVSLRGLSPSPSRSSAGIPDESPVEYRYEYALDRRGNWLSRRETAYVSRGGLLIPVGVKQIDRHILYREEERF
ncbi:MAG: hypothetical protein LBR93_07820 [Treponema sp.]|nr:hypothetical protein [Treponema sp.]